MSVSLVGAYRMGLSVLKICITNELTEGKEPKRENSKGMAMLAMSTLLFERYILFDCLLTFVGVCLCSHVGAHIFFG